MDEQKEPHFLAGKAKESALDNAGAIESFEKALEANPQNGSAHFELGLLFEKEADYAAAIYHFERFLKLHPDSEYAQVVKDRINNDKVELSKTAAFAMVVKDHQQQLDKLAEENNQLKALVERCRTLHGGLTDTRNATPDKPAAPVASVTQTRPPAPTPPDPQPPVRTSPPASRTYTVKAGDTPASIARRFNVKLETLLAANHGLDPKRMRVGQTLNIPAS
jgi:tetratricopeptide (TPR) repeat protein